MKSKYGRKSKQKSVKEQKRYFPDRALGSGLLRGVAKGIRAYHKRMKDI